METERSNSTESPNSHTEVNVTTDTVNTEQSENNVGHAPPTQSNTRQGTRIVPDFQGYVTRSGRVVNRPTRYEEDNPELYAIITTTQEFLHKTKPRTQRQKEKIKARIIENKKNKIPTDFAELNRALDREQYLKAVKVEMQAMKDRKVFTVMKRSNVPNHAGIGQLMLLLTKRRSGRYKSRPVFNGRHQRFKLSDHYSSPTLRHETLCATLVIAARRRYDFKSADISTGFLYSDLPENTILFTEIPRGHEDYEKRDLCVLRTHKEIYGLRESPLLWWRHLNTVVKKHTPLRQCVFDECAFSENELINCSLEDKTRYNSS